MGDTNDSAIFGKMVNGFLDLGFGLGIERCGGFVEDENGGVADEGARDGDALALAAGEALAPFAERRVVALRQRADEFVGVGFLRGGDDFSRASRRFFRKLMFSATVALLKRRMSRLTSARWKRRSARRRLRDGDAVDLDLTTAVGS